MSNKQLFTRMQQKIDTYENWSKAENFTPLKGEIIVYTTNETGGAEIKLKIGDGNTNVIQLPFISSSIPGGGAGGTQIQSDYNQSDDTQVDYIKNRPFYAIPPEVSFNFDFYRSREPMVWDGIILPNHPSISIPGSSMIYYKVSDNFITSADCLNCYMKYSLAPEVMEDDDMPEEMKEYDMYLPCSQEIMTQFTFFENADMFLNTFALSFNITGNIPLDDLGISLDVPETGTYFLYDTTGEVLAPGYVKAIEGALKIDLTDPDLANDPDLLPAADIYGSGTLLLAKKVSSEFLPVDKILNATLGANMVSWSMDDIDSSMSVKIVMSENMLSNGIDIIFGDDDTSYALLMEGTLPLFASISSPLATFSNGLQIPGPATYFAYNNLGREQGEMELWVNSFATPETVFQIDPKYIPKQKTFVPDYNEEDPESDSYIANRPYYNYSQYNYFNESDIDNISLRVGEITTEDGLKIFYQWGYDLNSSFKNPAMYNKGYSDIQCSKAYIRSRGDNSSLPVEGLSVTSSSNEKVSIVYKWMSDSSYYIPMAYIVFEDNVTDTVLVYGEGWNSESITFPKKGIYYYCQEHENSILYIYQLSDLKRYRNNLPSSNVTTTDSVTQGSSTPITSGGVYNALQNIKVTTDSEIIANSTNPVAGGAVYTALQNLNVKDADTVDGYHIRVSTEPPVEGEVDDYTITFII